MKTSLYVALIIALAGIALYCGYQWGAFTYTSLLLFIILLSWIVQREIKSSTKKSDGAENLLRAERDKLQLEVNTKTDELRKSEISRMYELGKIAEFGRLSQGLFHDLLSPLSGLALHLEKARGFTQEDLKNSHESLVKISNTSKRMNETLERLRENMSDAMPPRKCDVHEEIQHVLEILKFKTYEEDVQISLTQTDQCVWHGDPVKLHQIFSNIISNAIDAFEGVTRDKREVHITISRVSEACIIHIEDNGEGMSPEVMQKIFTPYFSTKLPTKGSGVGLSIVSKILKEIGGEIEVKSTLDVGSTFIITIR